jgi:hypothetical protein
MNTVSIELNNRAVGHLQAGNIVPAFDLLSKAYAITMQGVPQDTYIESENSTVRFHWEDFSSPFSTTWEGSDAFLFLRALRITISDNVKVDELCPCGYAWSIWFNLAICLNLMGTRMGERGHKLLELAFDLYNRVQKRINSEPTRQQSSNHWYLMQMAVVNNQACIYHDFAMGDATKECLEHLAMTVLQDSTTAVAPDSEDRTRVFFVFNLQILGTNCVAAAA